jgi:hypothetical protein
MLCGSARELSRVGGAGHWVTSRSLLAAKHTQKEEASDPAAQTPATPVLSSQCGTVWGGAHWSLATSSSLGTLLSPNSSPM